MDDVNIYREFAIRLENMKVPKWCPLTKDEPKNRKLKCYDIVWDTGEENIEGLSKEAIFTGLSKSEVKDLLEDLKYGGDMLSNRLSDITGWCVLSFKTKAI